MKVSYGEVVVDLQEEDNINVIIGDSGTGRRMNISCIISYYT